MSAIPLSPEPGLPGAAPSPAAAPGARAERGEAQRARRWYTQPALMIGIGIMAIVLAAGEGAAPGRPGSGVSGMALTG